MIDLVVIRGDGIGPEVIDVATRVLSHLGNFNFIYRNAGKTALETENDLLPDETLNSILKTKLCLKGPLETPVCQGFSSVNVRLRKELDLFVCLRPAKSIDNCGKFSNVDIVIFRENTEGAYICSLKQEEVTKIDDQLVAFGYIQISENASRRIAKYAYDWAVAHNRKKISIIHKANILKKTNGLFLDVCLEVSKNYPQIITENLIVDAAAMLLVQKPENFDIILTTNLFGDILSDLVAGLVGGLGIVGSANLNNEIALFEAVHGTAPNIVGKNIANPVAILRSCEILLEQVGLNDKSALLNKCLNNIIENKLTHDLGGSMTTTEISDYIIDYLRNKQ